MSKEDQAVILQAAARALAWDIFAAGAYGRTRTRVDLKAFDHELRTALRHWNATHKNLNQRKEP